LLRDRFGIELSFRRQDQRVLDGADER
jgi:hypothetical protein